MKCGYLFRKNDGVMRVRKSNVLPKEKRKKARKKKEEKVDWEELMGTKRDIYVRGKGGAIRRK